MAKQAWVASRSKSSSNHIAVSLSDSRRTSSAKIACVRVSNPSQ